MMTSIHELLQKEAQAVLNIPITDAYEKAVELIVEQIHRKKGKLYSNISRHNAPMYFFGGKHT